MQIQMDHIESHVSRTYDSHNRIQISAVIVAQPAAIMHDTGNLQYILVKESYRIGVRQHQSCNVIPCRLLQFFNVHAPLLA